MNRPVKQRLATLVLALAAMAAGPAVRADDALAGVHAPQVTDTVVSVVLSNSPLPFLSLKTRPEITALGAVVSVKFANEKYGSTSAAVGS